MERKIRVILAKPGLDGHDRGAKVIANALRDAGMEVIYLGLRQTPEMIVTAAVQEDADVISLSILSGAHMTIFPKVLDLLKAQKMDDVLLIGGGVIPEEDAKALKKLGVAEIFGPGSPTTRIVDYIQKWFQNSPRNQ
ncbi:MAG: cobalamin B12-binding domain-containing protein [Candidatus Neomarinimicrobiota bacterium]|jgi:methylmalonyl-CoA mutase C-terminal domain/subunit|nr:cobalamin B12-binding domain-containing protein [Candidatus Neomarinimicrobiota bacterium]MDD3965468.1 cobalamin B12-binding domain-containing protein [Candidatus Neomarinimicrobiota bacterium]MDX9780139.1 cobalamin B12-binding domain-containing protein [bacterium]